MAKLTLKAAGETTLTGNLDLTPVIQQNRTAYFELAGVNSEEARKQFAAFVKSDQPVSFANLMGEDAAAQLEETPIRDRTTFTLLKRIPESRGYYLADRMADITREEWLRRNPGAHAVIKILPQTVSSAR